MVVATGARIAVVGVGAIGGVIAARLAAAGHHVVLVARGEHLTAIQQRGLTVVDRLAGGGGGGGSDETLTLRLAASDDPAHFGPQDAVFLCVKGPAIAALLPRLRPLLDVDTLVVPAINGLPWWYFYRDPLASRWPIETAGAPRRIACLDPTASMFGDLDPARIIGCVVYLAAELTRPGLITHTASKLLVLGEPNGDRSARLLRVAKWWRDAGMDAQLSDAIRRDIWTKLVGNLSFNPVAALTGELMDRIVTNPALMTIIRPMIDEGAAVATALGVAPAVTTDQRIEMARAIGPVRLSTLQDFDARRRPELEGLLESVIELAELTGVAVPTIRQIAALLRAKARSLGLLD